MERARAAEVALLQKSLQAEEERRQVSDGELQQLRAEVAIGMEELLPLGGPQEEGRERSPGEGGREGGREGGEGVSEWLYCFTPCTVYID